MNVVSELSDAEFVPFLHGLGVETYNKSFEWILEDPSFSGVLRWLYNNLDHNNALTALEECRYKEIEKKGGLLTPEDLESSISAIKENHPGICIPGDHESIEDVELNVRMQNERLNVLKQQEMVLQDLISQNESTKKELTLELFQLRASHRECVEDEKTSAEECTSLAQEVKSLTDEVINDIATSLKVYSSKDKHIASRFLVNAPLESYRQTQALFRSRSDMFVSKNLVERQNDITDEEIRATMLQAKDMEERLFDAIIGYVDSQVELSGLQAKRAFVSNYNNVHPSQIETEILKTQSALVLLKQKEIVLKQQIQRSVASFVKSRTSLAVNTVISAAAAVRKQMLSSMTHLEELWEQAILLDGLLYQCLHHEERTMDEFLQFATQVAEYVRTDRAAVVSRMASMRKIIADQISRELKLQSSNPIVNILFAMFGATGNDASVLVHLYNKMQADLKDLKVDVDEEFRREEIDLMEMSKSSKPLRDYIWDGSTKQPNCWDRQVATLTHTLVNKIEAVEERVLEASSLFTTSKNINQENLRKLWHWFLTDPSKLRSAFENAWSD